MSNKRKRGVPAEDQDDGQQNKAIASGNHAPKIRKVETVRQASTTKKTSNLAQPNAQDTDTAASDSRPTFRRSSRIKDGYATAKGGTAIARSSGPKSLASAAKPGSVRTPTNKSTISSGVQTAPRSEASVASSNDGVVIGLHKSSPTPEEQSSDEIEGDAIHNDDNDDSDTIVVAMHPRKSVKKSQSSSLPPGTFELREAQISSVADGIAQQLEDPAESKYRNMRRNHESGLSSFKKWQGGGSYRDSTVAMASPVAAPSTQTVQRSSRVNDAVATDSKTVEPKV
ncbi:hypothetical protein LTR10_015017 [Elasticomyces elasticus]|nr:hypothetical protein LTR10_015017 [Elasticomyces elasticus]KAK4964593.1 hypothetical protein LTR42_012891 [Elasticomyces elasticus]